MNYPKAVILGNEQEIQSAIYLKRFSDLYNLIWKDIDPNLTDVKTVYYSPSGILNNVSFAGLCFSSADSMGTKKDISSLVRGVGIADTDSKQSNNCDTFLLTKYNLHQLTTSRYLADESLKKERKISLSIDLIGGINYDELPKDDIKFSLYNRPEDDISFQIDWKSNRISSSNKAGMKTDRDLRGDSPLEYLAGTREEVKNIQYILKQKNWKVYTHMSRDANEMKVKKELEIKKPGIIHISTHGFAFPDPKIDNLEITVLSDQKFYKFSENPMFRSGVFLSGANITWTGNQSKMLQLTGDDGVLTAAEVSNLNLSRTKLVVLSACETGLGKIEGSEGTFGLKRAFKLAGVEQLIVSLWKVPDKETQELMTIFYKNLSRSLNPVQSFEKAQKKMHLKYPNQPEKWAGFVLVR